MGAFDNLIPVPTPDKPQGAFDNLIPDERFKDKRRTGAFDHLIPGNERNPVSLPEHPSTPKLYWDATKQALVDITGDIKKGFGDKSIAELVKTESLPAHLIQGITRDNAIDLDVDTSGGLIATSHAKDAPKEDKPSQSMLDTLKGLGVTLRDKPGLLIGSLGKTIVADPELLLPWLWEAIPEATAAKVAQAAKAMGASVDIAKAAEVGGRVAGRMATGAGVNVAVEAADQFAKGEIDPGALGTSAAEGAAFSIPGRMVGKERPVLRPENGPREHETVPDSPPPQTEPDLTPQEAATVAQVPEERLSPFDQTRESLAQAVEEHPVTPEMIAEVAKEPIKSPTEARERLTKAIKQAAIGGAIGAGVGYAVADKDKKSTGVETGAFLGVVAPLLKARKYTGVDISQLVSASSGQVRVVARHVYQFQHQLEKLLPVKADREALSEMIDRGVEPAHGTPMHEAYTQLKKFFSDMGQAAVDSGVIDELRDNYVTHVVVEDPHAGKSVLAKLRQSLLGGGNTGAGTSGKSFGKERKYATFEELNVALKDSGLKLKTKDASEIAGIYANAVYRSISNKRLLEALKQTRTSDGHAVVMPVKDAPHGYVKAASPQLASVAIHPDIAPDLGFVFSHRNPNWLRDKAEALTSAIKRVNVSASLFHAKSLTEGYLAAGSTKWNPAAALRMFREGGNNDVIDTLIKHGLIVGTPEDVAGREVQHALSKVGDMFNEKLPIAGKIPKALAAVDRGVEHFTFGFLQTGMKLNVAMSEMERMVSRGIPKERAASIAASFTNDVFGSLDWYRVATDTTSHIFRKLGTAALAPNARKLLQLALFAPDWTLATFRTAAKAMPGGAEDAIAMQLHRRYLVRAAINYFILANAVNYALSGHSIFENKSITRVELGDGRTMQFAKHETEPLDWLKDPLKTAGNKLAFIPGAIWKRKGTVDRAEAYKKQTPPLVSEIAMEAAPFSMQQFIQHGLGRETLLGALGFPVYGQSDEEKAAAKEQRRTARQDKAHEKLYGETQ